MKAIPKTLLWLAAGALLAAPALGRDRFEYDPTPEGSKKEEGKPPAQKKPASGKTEPAGGVGLAVGEIREAYNAKGSSPEMAFYVPASSPSLVQVIVEKKAFRAPVYFVKGLSRGRVTGGLVQRSWLDKGGFKPNNLADEARIQAAIKANPIVITVK